MGFKVINRTEAIRMIRRMPILRLQGRLSRWLGVFAVLAVVTSNAPAHAAGIQFATFTQLPDDKNPYVFTNNGVGTGTLKALTQVNFQFTDGSGVPDTSMHVLTLELSASTNVAALKAGNLLDQAMNGQPPINGLNSLKIYDANHTNYLSMTFTGDISGQIGSANAQFSGDTQVGQVVNYSSAFVNFASGASFMIGLPTVTLTDMRNPPPNGSQGLQLGVGGLLANFTSNAQGSFSANLAVPVPTSAVLFGTGLASTAALSGWRKRRASLAHSNEL